jgi:hypothetical protein
VALGQVSRLGDVKVVLITGAGASRPLGRDEPMPLMGDWSDQLIGALSEKEAKLAQAVGLTPGLAGDEFERRLGAFLRWRETRELAEQFAGFGGPEPGSQETPVIHHRQREDQRIEIVLDVLNHTLYELFGRQRINDDSAEGAYRALLRPFDQSGQSDKGDLRRDLVCVTTNYDMSLEVGLAGRALQVESGFVSRGYGTTPVLSPAGMLERAREVSRVPVLHLHGAVGWYSDGAEVRQMGMDFAFNDSLGSPVVLYPDPDKDPTRDVLVAELWSEFQEALDQSTHILVVGHSLHDAPLVRLLAQAGARVGVIVYDGVADAVLDAELQRVRGLVPDAHVIPGSFGPEPEFSKAEYDAWLQQSKPVHPAYIRTAN